MIKLRVAYPCEGAFIEPFIPQVWRPHIASGWIKPIALGDG